MMGNRSSRKPKSWAAGNLKTGRGDRAEARTAEEGKTHMRTQQLQEICLEGTP